MAFPAEAVPDGAIFAPHHAYVGAIGLVFVLAVVWDDYARLEPVACAVGLAFVAFGFALVWPYYPVTGASMALAGNLLILLALALPAVGTAWRDQYGALAWLSAVVFALIIADDLVSHAFGVWTPLDAIWKVAYHGGMIH